MGEEIESLESRMANLNRVIDDHKKKFLLNQFTIDNVDIQKTIPELQRMESVDVTKRVMQWRAYAQAISNRRQELKAKLSWVIANWDMYMGINQQYVSKEYGFSTKDRQMIILETDSYAQKLYKLKMDIEIEMTLTENVTINVNYLAEAGQKIADHNMWRERNANYRN